MFEAFSEYWAEFITIALAHLAAVASPGPDFAVVLRQSLIFGRRKAVICSIGVGLGIAVHVLYALLGIGLLIKSSALLFNLVKWAGALYLIWIGIGALKSQKAEPKPDEQVSVQADQSDWQAFRLGFLTNVLNPKATLFFLSLFSVIVSIETPTWVQAIYGGWMTFATGAWFVMLSLLFSGNKVRQFFADYSHWIDRVLGALLIVLACYILLSA